MKRFTILFTLLLLIVEATTKAQTPDATPITDAEVATGYYFIASTSETAYGITSPYIAANSGAMKLVAKDDVTTDYANSKVGLWYIEKTGTSNDVATYRIKSCENSYYWAAGPACPMTSAAGVYNIIQTDDQSGYYFSGNGGGITNTAYVNASSATTFERSSSGSYNTWKLIPAGVRNITLAYTAGNRTFNVTQTSATNQQLSTALEFYTNCTPATITVDGETDTYQVTATAAFPFEEGKFYKAKIRHASSGNRSVVWDGIWGSNIETRSAVTESNNALWCLKFVEGTQNQVYLCNALDGGNAYVNIASTNNNLLATMSPNGTPFICTTGNTETDYTQGFRLQALSTENANLNDVNGKLGYWNNSGSKTDGGSTFTLFEATYNDVEDATIVATNTATNTAITLENVHVVSTQSGNDILSHNSFFNFSGSSYNSDTKTFSINYTSTAPYTLSTESTKNWQVIRTRDDESHYLKLNGSNIQSRNSSMDRTTLSGIRTFTENDETQWAILPANTSFGRFYLVNKADDTKKAYLASETQGQVVEMSNENATAFFLAAQPSAFTSFTGGFTIQPNCTNEHAIGDHLSGNLGYWSNRGSSELNDGGSIFRIVDLVSDCKSIAAANTNTAYVGDIASDANTALAAQTTVDDFFAKFDELETSGELYSKPQTDKLYRITFTRGSVSPALTNATADANGTINEGDGNTPAERLVTFATQSQNTPSAIVRFVSVADEADTYTIQDVNSKLYYGSKGEDGKLYAVANPTYAGHYAVANSINGTINNVALKNTLATNITAQYLWSRGDNESDVTNYYNYIMFHSPYNNNATTGDQTSIEAGCVMQIQEVTSYPITISEAGYASLCLPFSVTLPDGLTANKVTAVTGDDKEMTLVNLSSTLAAGEPIILQGDANTYTLTVNTDNGTAETDNILTGASVKRTGITDTYYALGYKALTDGDDTKTAGFYRVTTGNMPANKAYLLKANIPAEAQQAMMFSFNFGGNTTGIGQATATDSDSNVYYDLNGRRVLYPTRGIYVKANGQKVFIK